MENIFNPHYHSETDLVEYCNFDYMAEVTRISCACIMYSDMTVGISEEPADFAFELYPNPAKDNAVIKYELEYPCKIKISLFDISGKKVMDIQNDKVESGSHYVRFDVTCLPAGIYSCIISTNDITSTRKLVVIE